MFLILGFVGCAFTRNSEALRNPDPETEPREKMPPLPKPLDSSKGEDKSDSECGLNDRVPSCNE
jgi:hypothetical protein